ncbi:Metacaspase-9 [Platanthera guangdongensis]|uniref:Metacaspase-9 n=1 Tax=Platanthera guangdongensis TaxID=2320717 RepID=A0ABR2LJD3_9ASPA
MKDLLVERFRFDAADIVVLTDEPGSQVLLTGANVRRALGHMVDRTEPNDVLFFHFSGHETFVPAARPHNRHHHRDDAILPCDFNPITDFLNAMGRDRAVSCAPRGGAAERMGVRGQATARPRSRVAGGPPGWGSCRGSGGGDRRRIGVWLCLACDNCGG